MWISRIELCLEKKLRDKNKVDHFKNDLLISKKEEMWYFYPRFEFAEKKYVKWIKWNLKNL